MAFLNEPTCLIFHHERHEFREIDATASILVRVVDHVLDLVLRRILASNSNFQNEMMFYIFGFDVGPNIRDSSSLNPRNRKLSNFKIFCVFLKNMLRTGLVYLKILSFLSFAILALFLCLLALF